MSKFLRNFAAKFEKKLALSEAQFVLKINKHYYYFAFTEKPAKFKGDKQQK